MTTESPKNINNGTDTNTPKDDRVAGLFGVPYSGKSPAEPRSDSNEEAARKEAINIVGNYADVIKAEAKKNNVAPESVAGAILWEGTENGRTGSIPGKMHSGEAEKLYREGRVPREYTPDKRNDPKVAIAYTAAYMNYAAETYQRIAGVNIRDNSGVLTTLYHGGDVLQRAQNLRNNRAIDVKNGKPPREPQVPPKEMGAYVQKYQGLIRGWLGTTKSQGLDNSGETQNVANGSVEQNPNSAQTTQPATTTPTLIARGGENQSVLNPTTSQNPSSDPPAVQADNGAVTEQAESSEKPVLIARGGVPTLQARGGEPAPTLQARGGDNNQQIGLSA